MAKKMEYSIRKKPASMRGGKGQMPPVPNLHASPPPPVAVKAKSPGKMMPTKSMSRSKVVVKKGRRK